MNKEIENLIQLNTIRDIEIALMKSKSTGAIIPDEVFNIIKEVENGLNGALDKVAEKDYDKTHSLCCDAQIINGRCADCKDNVK